MFNIWQNAVRVNQCTAVAASFRFHKFNPWLGCDLFSVDLWWELCSQREVGREDNITALYLDYLRVRGVMGGKLTAVSWEYVRYLLSTPPTPPHPSITKQYTQYYHTFLFRQRSRSTPNSTSLSLFIKRVLSEFQTPLVLRHSNLHDVNHLKVETN